MLDASFRSGVREAGTEAGPGREGWRGAPGKGPALPAAGPAPDGWRRAASELELVRLELAAARRGPLAELGAAITAGDVERVDKEAGALGWTLASTRTRLGDAEDAAAGALDLVREIERLREEERTLAREVAELRARAAAVPASRPPRVFGFQDAVDGYAAFYRAATGDARAAAATPEPAAPGATASEWIAHHAANLEQAIASRLDAVPIVPGHTRLAWSGDGGRFLGRVLSRALELAGRDPWSGVRRAVLPADLDDIVDGARVLDHGVVGGARGPLRWFPEVAIAIADVLAGRVVDSLARLAPRFVAVADVRTRLHPGRPAAMNAPEVADLVPAHPVDPAVIAALCGGLVEVLPGPAVTEGVVALGAAGSLRRVVRYEWQARRDAWSWLRVHEPADASLEEVAATFLGRPEAAYRVSASPPLFGFLPEDAARIPGARDALPLSQDAGQAALFLDLARPVESLLGGGVTAHPVDQLAESELGDEAALDQAARAAELRPDAGEPAAADRDEASEELCVASSSLALIAHDLRRFGLSWRVREVRERVAARRQLLREVTGAEIGRWRALGSEQARVLDDIAAELDSLVRVSGGARAGEAVDPALIELAGELADAAAVSDLVESAAARLEAARSHKAAAIAVAFDHQLDRAMHELEAVRAAAHFHGPDQRWVGKKVLVDDLRARDAELRAEVSRMRIRLAQGEVESAAIEDLERRVRAAAREAELVAAISRLNPVLSALEDEQGWMAIFTLCEDDLEDSRQELLGLRSSLQLHFRTWNQRQADLAARAASFAPGEAAEAARVALAELESGLRGLGNERVERALQRAHDTVENARTRKAIADIALLVGTTLVSCGAGAAMRGAALGLRWGRAGVALAELSGEAGSMTVMRATTSDDTVLEALVSELGGHGAMTFAGHAVRATRLGDSIAFMRQQGRGGRLAAAAADGGLHTGSMAGGQLLAAEGESLWRDGRLLTGDEAAAVAGHAAMTGAAFSLSHRILGRYLDRMSRLGARAQDLVTRGHRARRLADEIARSGDPEAALAIARLERELVEAELVRLDELARDPEALAEIGPKTHATLLAQALADSTAFSEQGVRGLKLHLTPDTARSSRAANILREAEAVGIPRSVHQQDDGSLRHRVGEGEAHVDLIETRDQPWQTDLAGDDAHFAPLEVVFPGTLYRGTRDQIARAFKSLHLSDAEWEASFTSHKPISGRSRPESGRWEVTIGLRRFQIDERFAAPAEAEVWQSRAVRPEGISDGPVSLDRFVDSARTAEALEIAQTRAAIEAAGTLADFEPRFKTVAARPLEEAVALTKEGGMPRFVARAGALDDLRSYETFVRPDRDVGFATEPADLYGLSPAGVLFKVGWTRRDIERHTGQHIAVVVVDMSVPVPDAAGEPSHMLVGSAEWSDLVWTCMRDDSFVDAAARFGISRSRLGTLFEIASRSPVKGMPASREPDVVNDMAVLYMLLHGRKGANELLTGVGMTMQEDGRLGAREVLIRPNGSGYRLTPDNHRIVDLGVLTKEDINRVFGGGDQ